MLWSPEWSYVKLMKSLQLEAVLPGDWAGRDEEPTLKRRGAQLSGAISEASGRCPAQPEGSRFPSVADVKRLFSSLDSY